MKQTHAKRDTALLAGLFAVFFLFSTTATWARPRPNRRRILEKIETIKMWKMMDALNLDSQTALKVFPIVREIDKKRLGLREKQRVILEKIETLTKNGKVNDKKLNALAQQLFSLNEQISQLPKEEYQKLKPYLSQTQLAKLLIFQKNFRRELIRRWMLERHGFQKRTKKRPRGPMNQPPQG